MPRGRRKQKQGPADGGDAPAEAPGLLVVAEPHTLHWPRDTVSGRPPIRGGPGTVVPADDPLLQTEELPEPFRRQHRLVESDQRFKLRPAPKGARISPHNAKGAKEVYDALGYDRIPYGWTEDGDGAVRSGTPAAPRQRQSTAVTVPPVDE